MAGSMAISIAIVTGAVVAVLGVACMLRYKNLYIWVPSYIMSYLKGRDRLDHSKPVDVLFCIVDHFEPRDVTVDARGQATRRNTYPEETAIMNEWLRRYPEFSSGHYDSDGIPPRHTWCFPIENYDAQHLEKLAKLCQQGLGEIEVHLHHFFDNSQSFRRTIGEGLKNLASHGATVLKNNPGRHAFAFVHGNWSLDNAGGDEVCGVNDEISLLSEAGCFADFTLPCAPNRSQTRKINAIYYAEDDRESPKSHDQGEDVHVGSSARNRLMIIQGPLSLNWKKRKFGVLPRIENAEVSMANPITPDRIRLWLRTGIHVKGRPNWIFIKVHCHAGHRDEFEAFLGPRAHEMYAHLENTIQTLPGYRLHYVTAREMYNIAKAAEAGKDGNPHICRDYSIAPYMNSHL